ncbi:MAG: WhiB family transcriptional regulator [Egibacteraceae bacterium]
MDWRHKAACLDEDPETFFPIGSIGPALDQIERAKQVCAVCSVKAICLEWALRTRQPHGVWGGLDEDERRDLRSARVRWRKAAPDQPDGRDGR